MHSGWYQLAYQRDLTQGLNLAWIGDHPLALVRRGEAVTAYDARCPHRGANLCVGGTLDGDAVICPFHGYRVQLGSEGEGFHVREYRVLPLGGLVFVRDPDGRDCGLEAYLNDLERNHYIVPGFTMELRTSPELVIENAFDNSHFQPVHGILNEPRFERVPDRCGEFGVSGTFVIPASPWQKSADPADEVAVPFRAIAFSPTVVVSELGGENPYFMITSAVPLGDGCAVRLSLALAPQPDGRPPSQDGARYLLRQATAGLEKDRVIWENLPREPWLDPVPGDRWVQGFREFAAGFARD